MKNIFKYINPKYWITRRKYKNILNWIIRAKIRYNTIYGTLGMCRAFIESCDKIIKLRYDKISYYVIKYIIPEFNPQYLEAPWNYGFWWNIDDKDSRNKAFDKLIECYKNKIKEL